MDNNLYPQRKSPRLKDYDYASEGAYFITICTQNRLHLFGHITHQQMKLNSAGQMVTEWWLALSDKFEGIVDCDYFVVMPNHLHGIIVLRQSAADDHAGSSLRKIGIPDIIGWFKTMTTNAYIKGVKGENWQRFDRRLWQHSYHDHIIRNAPDLNRPREYILYNPSTWQQDTFFTSTT